jgi:hypothetical protein
VSAAEIASRSYRDDPAVKPHDWPDVPEEPEDEYPTLPDEIPEEVKPRCYSRAAMTADRIEAH